VTLGAGPDLSLRPEREFAQFLRLGMIDVSSVWQRQAGRIEDTCFRPKMFQQTLGLECQETAVGSFTQGAVKQQDTRRVGRGCRIAQPANARNINVTGIEIGNII